MIENLNMMNLSKPLMKPNHRDYACHCDFYSEQCIKKETQQNPMHNTSIICLLKHTSPH